MAAYELHNGSFNTGEDGYSNHTRVFRVYTDDPTDLPIWGIAEVAINRFDAHPDDATCLANSASCVPVSGELGWFEVTYTYTNKPFDQGLAADSGDVGGADADDVANPTSRTATVRFSHTSRNIPFLKDYDSPRKAVANSAGQPFEGQETEEVIQVITVNKNLAASTDMSLKQAAYINRINDDDFQIVPIWSAYPVYTLRCVGYGGTLQNEPGFGWYLAAEITFEYKWDGWTRSYIDQGYYYKVAGQYDAGGQQVYRKFLDNATGMPLDSPRKLNGAGLPLPDGDPDVTLSFYPYQEADFTNILS